MGTKKSKTGIKVKKSKSKISFDEEIITKSNTENALDKIVTVQSDGRETLLNTSKSQLKKKRKMKEGTHINKKKGAIKQKNTESIEDDVDTNKESKILKTTKKRDISQNSDNNHSSNHTNEDIEGTSVQTKSTRKRKLKQPTAEELEAVPQDDIQEELNPMQPTINTTESLRKKKKKRHIELVDSKRLQTELNSQQKALNYLSKWKHIKDQWKFEKLTQAWIQNNLYDDTKLPDKIWTTVVEYFNLAKGKVRNDILKNAVQLYEKENTSENPNDLILNRAKSIVQLLNE